MIKLKQILPFIIATTLSLTIIGCGSLFEGGDSSSFPVDQDDKRKAARGKVTGEEGLSLGGGNKNKESSSPIGVNGFLWRATLDTLSFMPMTSADPFGGVILTDWYEDPNSRGDRLKITALILDRTLRADGIKISVFKQSLDANNLWRDKQVNVSVAKKIEDTILTRARELRIKQSAN
jgi:hypothetical protein